jgi:hypothetical protein
MVQKQMSPATIFEPKLSSLSKRPSQVIRFPKLSAGGY